LKCTTQVPLRLSEVLANFRIHVHDRVAFSGKAVISSLIHTGNILVCAARLDDGWTDGDAFALPGEKAQWGGGYDEFVQRWQSSQHVSHDFKLWVAEVQTYLLELRLWADQIELGIRGAPAGDRMQMEYDVVKELSKPVTQTLNHLFERFETIAASVSEEFEPAHHAYLKRHLHPLVLCSPFAYRVFHKPLGYAGDYEMVNMLLRDPQEGSSVFAKLINAWFIAQPPAQAHRNRIEYLSQILIEETLRTKSRDNANRVFSLGCGPAAEVQHFMSESPLSNQARFALLDFNDETLQYANSVLSECKNRHQRQTQLQFIKKSVVQILKGAARSSPGAQENKYDFIYCAGLFDYLPDRICKELIQLLYDMLAPGGLLLGTNVDVVNPIRHMLDYLLEWHLIYRTGTQMRNLVPALIPADEVSLRTDVTGVNLLLQIRRPSP
jgi:extracellular factor (EF) 3-hydroxypalmitic acid methyl ester biosynthesis protein